MKSLLVCLAFLIVPSIALAQGTVVVDAPFQIGIGTSTKTQDTLITVTNTGVRGASTTPGNTADITGAICANFYAFSAVDGSFVSCCTCPVAPNAARVITVNRDLAPNANKSPTTVRTLVKLIGTLPVAGVCEGGATAASTLTSGLVAWRSNVITTSSTTDMSSYQTESPFVPAVLSAGELNKMLVGCENYSQLPNSRLICRDCQ
ncbi:MAG: hypothetical protein K1X83_12835 [Oligoflexia bacterium]|nr:hypothetical protein [Oligoflexia bacterium]